MPMRSNLDFLSVIILSLIVGLTTFTHVEMPLTRALFGLPFLLATGYAAYSAISLIQRSHPAEPTPLFERTLYTIAFTLVLVVLGGIILNNTAWGIHRESWTLFLVTIAVVSSLFGVYRRQEPIRFALSFSPRKLLVAGSYASLVLLALAISTIGDQTRPTDGFTMLWTLPNRTKANILDIGVQSEEHMAQDYHLSLLLDGAPFGDYPSILLQPGAEWSASLSLPPGVKIVEAQLFRVGDDAATPYRSTHVEWSAIQRLQNDTENESTR